ncbi:hypothetical protein BJX61DRAFT_509966 [Aspergillus egyptiacus]|nr:hypothetical protein BJX61DRAFT_509966 [Aspergillus egyptiacus]
MSIYISFGWFGASMIERCKGTKDLAFTYTRDSNFKTISSYGVAITYSSKDRTQMTNL